MCIGHLYNCNHITCFVKCLFQFLQFFKKWFVFLLLSSRNSSYILVWVLGEIFVLQTFSPNCGLLFSHLNDIFWCIEALNFDGIYFMIIFFLSFSEIFAISKVTRIFYFIFFLEALEFYPLGRYSIDIGQYIHVCMYVYTSILLLWLNPDQYKLKHQGSLHRSLDL